MKRGRKKVKIEPGYKQTKQWTKDQNRWSYIQDSTKGWNIKEKRRRKQNFGAVRISVNPHTYEILQNTLQKYLNQHWPTAGCKQNLNSVSKLFPWTFGNILVPVREWRMFDMLVGCQLDMLVTENCFLFLS